MVVLMFQSRENLQQEKNLVLLAGYGGARLDPRSGAVLFKDEAGLNNFLRDSRLATKRSTLAMTISPELERSLVEMINNGSMEGTSSLIPLLIELGIVSRKGLKLELTSPRRLIFVADPDAASGVDRRRRMEAFSHEIQHATASPVQLKAFEGTFETLPPEQKIIGLDLLLARANTDVSLDKTDKVGYTALIDELYAYGRGGKQIDLSRHKPSKFSSPEESLRFVAQSIVSELKRQRRSATLSEEREGIAIVLSSLRIEIENEKAVLSFSNGIQSYVQEIHLENGKYVFDTLRGKFRTYLLGDGESRTWMYNGISFTQDSFAEVVARYRNYILENSLFLGGDLPSAVQGINVLDRRTVIISLDGTRICELPSSRPGSIGILKDSNGNIISRWRPESGKSIYEGRLLDRNDQLGEPVRLDAARIVLVPQ